MPHLLLLGTFDTKLPELLHLNTHLLSHPSTRTTLIDCGRTPTPHSLINISQTDLTTTYAPPNPLSQEDISKLPRGELINYMIQCTTNYLRHAYTAGLQDPAKVFHGAIGAGGTGNTSLVSAALRAVLPIGFPKLLVTTNASADVSSVVGETDLCLMPSIVDVAGRNELLNTILANAAGAVVGMAGVYEGRVAREREKGVGERKKRVGLSMFGVTTRCVDRIRGVLEKQGVECFVFHQTGTGGKAMERLVEEGGLDAVCDVTTTELCDHVCGGVMDSGPRRLEAALTKGIPYVISCGALDMCNFGPRATVPEKYADRKLFEHNPSVSLMRTNVEESRKIGEMIVEKVKRCTREKGMVRVVLPLGGVSIIATPDGPFYDAQADEALFGAIREGLKAFGVHVVEDPRAINDEGFADDMAKMMVEMMGL